MKKQKSGISLIVLVITIIVIIILAVAVILSIANNNPISNANKAKFQNDLKSMQEELELIKSSNYANNNGKSYGTIQYTELNGSEKYPEKFAIQKGELCYIDFKLSDNEKEWADEAGIKKAMTFEKKGGGDLAIGGEITASNGEAFYVIGGDTVGTEISNSTQNVILLAKYNLTLDGTKQDTSGKSNECAFCSETAWSGSNIKSGENLNDKITISSEKTSAVGKVIAYGDTLGVAGRLMTYEEAGVLATNYFEILCGNKDGKTLGYWLGTADSNQSVWPVYGHEIQSR